MKTQLRCRKEIIFPYVRQRLKLLIVVLGQKILEVDDRRKAVFSRRMKVTEDRAIQGKQPPSRPGLPDNIRNTCQGVYRQNRSDNRHCRKKPGTRLQVSHGPAFV